MSQPETTVITIGGKKYITGLTWRPLEGNSAKHVRLEVELYHRERHARLSKPQFGCLLQAADEGLGNDPDTPLAFEVGAIGIDPTPPKVFSMQPPAPSLAGTIAKVGSSDGLYLLELGYNHLWFVAIQNGLVLSGTDRWLDRDSAATVIEEELETATNPDTALFTNIDGIDEVLGVSADAVVVIDVEQFLEGAEDARLTRISGVNVAVVSLAGVALLLIGLIAIVVNSVFENNAPEMPVVQTKHLTPEEIRALAVSAVLTNIRDTYNNEGALIAPAWAIKAHNHAIQMKYNLVNWTYAGASCQPIKGCVYSWKGGPRSGVAYMREKLDSTNGRIEAGPNSRDVVYRQLGETLWAEQVRTSATALNEEWLFSRPTSVELQTKFGDWCNRWELLTGAKCAFSKPKDIDASAINEINALYAWSIKVKGTQRIAFDSLMDIVSTSSAYVSTYELDADGEKPIWEVEVFYVAQQ